MQLGQRTSRANGHGRSERGREGDMEKSGKREGERKGETMRMKKRQVVSGTVKVGGRNGWREWEK